jgi:hypothetical protein
LNPVLDQMNPVPHLLTPILKMFFIMFFPTTPKFPVFSLHVKSTTLRGFSPQANYTDRAIAAGERS